MSTLSIAANNFRFSRENLRTQYSPDEDPVTARQPKKLKNADQNGEAYFLLVNYITSIVARVVVRSATSSYWNNLLLSIIAQWSAKLKLLTKNPIYFAQLSMLAAEDVIAKLIDEQLAEGRISKIKHSDDPESTDIDASAGSEITGSYYQENCYARTHLEYLIRHAAGSLYASEKTGNDPDTFDLCTVVYETGLTRDLIMLGGDRGGNVSAFSDKLHIKYGYTAMDLLLRNSRHIGIQPRGPDNPTQETIIKWQGSEGLEIPPNNTESIRTSKLDEVVSL